VKHGPHHGQLAADAVVQRVHRVVDDVRVDDVRRLARVGRLGQERQRLGVVAPFAVAEAPELLTGRLQVDVDALGAQVENGEHGRVHALGVGHQRVGQPGRDTRFVQVKGHVDVFLDEQPANRVGDLLGQRAVRLARVHPVQVADFLTLVDAAVGGDVYFRIRLGLVGRVGAAGAVAELALQTALDFNGERGRHVVPVAVVVVDVGVVAVGNDDEPARGRDGPLHQDNRGHLAGNLVAVGAALDVRGAALNTGVNEVNPGVAGSALQRRVVVAQPPDAGTPVAGTDVVKCRCLGEDADGHDKHHQCGGGQR